MKKSENHFRFRLNLSQREIMLSEDVFSSSPINVISLKLYSKTAVPEELARACRQVFEQGDIFSAVLRKEQGEWVFCPGEGTIKNCGIHTEIRSMQEAEDYMARRDEVFMDCTRKLYDAEAFPVSEGGAFLYVRFHHVLIDGYGMSLFAQRAVDVLEGRGISFSEFFRHSGDGAQLGGEGASGSVSQCFLQPGGGFGQEKEQKESKEEFWRRYFGEGETEPAVFTEQAGGYGKLSWNYTIPEEVQRAALITAEKAGVTLPYVYGAAFAVYLSGASGRERAVFLMPRLGRRPQEMDRLGCYTLLVPVQAQVSPEDTFTEICRKTAESARLASANKEIGYDRILGILRKEHSISSVPSQYVLNWYRQELHSDTGCRVSFSVAGAMHNHLSFNLFQENGGVYARLDLRQGIYDKRRAEFFMDGIFAILLQGAESGREIKDISIIGERERACLSRNVGKQYEIDENATIPSLLAQVAQRYPHRPAVYAGEVMYTFQELEKLAAQIASGLAARGVGSGDTVAFMLKRDHFLLPTLFGVSKSGAAFIPVDPAYPEDRVKYILEDSHASLLISSGKVKAAKQYAYVDVEELIRSKRTELPRIRQEDLAYMIYTSGTTGWPKGVMLSHRGIVNIVHPDNNPFNRDAAAHGKGIVAIGSVCFDISLFEFFVPLFNGKFVELGNETAMLDARALAEHIQKHGADMLHCTPSRIAEYLEHPEFRKAMEKISMILSAGETLPSELARRLKEQYHIRIYNGYGPTETTIGATITEAGDTESIGRPIGNTGIFLLNHNGGLMPWGAVGEICVYGKGLGLGYRGREEETRRKFVETGGRMVYRTGDLGHFLEDGRLIYHGRCDRQVKLRGLRIELSEIESVMAAYPGIRQTACIVKREKETEYLAGFFTALEKTEDISGKLQEYMRSRLTAYMVPEVLVHLPSMPQTPGGKLDMKALETIEIVRKRSYTAPETEAEHAVCRAFEKILKQRQIGVKDNFFESGGDSLMVMELILEIERLMGTGGKLELEVQDIYAYPTPGQIAEKLTNQTKEKKGYPIETLDYKGFDAFLKREEPLKTRKPGVILLTGVTGYLGVHILIDFLRNPERFDKIICLARPKGKLDAQKRVKNALFYYGENDFADSYGIKWQVAEGDITESGLSEGLFEEPIDLIVNAAANVAHVAYGDVLEKVNIDGIRNLIGFALEKDAELVQVSTISVSGVHRAETELPLFTEHYLFAGQEIHSQYIYSKFMAEYEMIRAGLKRNLRFKIMRVGNLQGRSRDGEFQMNMKSNNFTRQLSSYVKMGIVPQSLYQAGVNFSLVDEVARMIGVLLEVVNPHGIYHVYPREEVEFSRIFAALRRQGFEVSVLPDQEFEEKFSIIRADPKRQEQVKGLLMERPDSRYLDTAMSQELTQKTLEALGEHWLPVTEEYLEKCIDALNSLDMF